jgi:mandelate racemase
MKRPLGTSAQTIDTASLLLVDLLTDEGITGRAYAFCYMPSIARSLVRIVAGLSGVLAGQPLIPLDLTDQITRHFKLPGVVGPLAMVASSVDMAMWDALAIAADMPLASFLGASPHQVPAYNSNGLGLMSPGAAADEAEALLENGFRAVKLRLGRGEIGLDLAVRKRLPDQVLNQALTFSDAMQYCLTLDEEGVYWIEEPIRHDANPDRRELRRVGTNGRCARSVGVGLCHAGS